MDLEHALEDLLDEDFIKIFQPINTLQKYMGYLRVDMKYKIATATSNYVKCYSIVLSIVLICLFCESIKNKSDYSNGEILLYLGFTGNLLLSTAAVWLSNFTKEDMNSQFFIKLQKIDRYLNIPDMAEVNLKIAKASLITTIVMTVTCFKGLMLLKNNFNWTPLLFIFIEIGPYIEIILLLFVLFFVSIRVEFINGILKKNASKYKNNNIVTQQVCFFFELPASNKHDNIGDGVVLSLRMVLEVLVDFVNLFQFSILAYTTQIMLWSFILIQSLIFALKDKNLEELIAITFIVSSLLLMLGIQMVLCFVADGLMGRLRDTKKLCIDIISSSTQGTNIENSTKMLLFLGTDTSINIFDIYTLDTRLPMHLLAITTSYTIVLLQFGLL